MDFATITSGPTNESILEIFNTYSYSNVVCLCIMEIVVNQLELNYLGNISSAVSTTLKGLSLSIKYFLQARKGRKKEGVAEDNYFDKADGTFTVQYPHEKIPVPDHGRYQLHNEIDDCIVCDKCAKICPVDCIDIEPVRSPEVFGKTSVVLL